MSDEELQEINRKLYNSMKAFQIAAEESGNLVFTYDTKKQTIFVDEKTAAAFGVAVVQPGVPYDMVARGIISKDSVDEYVRIHEAVINGANQAGGVVKLIQADGSESVQELRFRAIIDENGQPTGTAVGVYRDITAVVKRESNYQKLEHILQGLKKEYLAIIEVNLDTDTYRVLHITPKAMEVIPLDESGCYSAAVDKFLDCVVMKKYRDDFREISSVESLRNVLKDESHIELEYLSAADNSSWRRTMFQVLEYRNGIPVTVAMYQSDIDKMKNQLLSQQQALKDAYNFAEAANAAKTDFLSRMSHDIRTPMNAIIGMTAIAGTNLDNPVRLKECLSKITVSSRHLLSLINEVLDMSKIESGSMELQLENFNLADLLDNMVSMVMPMIEKHNHELEVSVGKLHHEWVTGDSLRIQQIFVNILSNAAKYTPDGGKIRISVQEKSSGSDTFGAYEFRFEDNGIGMSEEFQKILFEPFTRAEDSRLSKITGTGLGMAITKNLIHMMDGSISVESALNKGSVFTVCIHLQFQEDQQTLPEHLKELPVLVVDDDQITCESTCIILDDIGMKGEWCLTGKEAVERTVRRHNTDDDYFAVIVDWKMPEMDGIDTVREIRKRVGPDIPIIILTAYNWSEIEDEAKKAGVNKFLLKPLFKSRLINSFCELTNSSAEEKASYSGFDVLPDVDFSGRRILLVEDNELNAEIAQELLENTGVKVKWASNGKEAVEIVESSEEGTYDMILMDIQMPVMDGYKATAMIRSLDRRDVKTMPIIAMTANAFAEDVNHAVSAGMDEHIAKPVDIKKLENLMAKYLSR